MMGLCLMLYTTNLVKITEKIDCQLSELSRWFEVNNQLIVFCYTIRSSWVPFFLHLWHGPNRLIFRVREYFSTGSKPLINFWCPFQTERITQLYSIRLCCPHSGVYCGALTALSSACCALLLLASGTSVCVLCSAVCPDSGAQPPTC